MINKTILLAKGYTEIDELPFIIKACRLRPYDYIFNRKRFNKLQLCRHWVDEYYNSLKITGKSLKITLNDLMLDKTKITCSDLYYGLTIDKIVKISKLAYVMVGRDEDLNENCCLISLLGIDDYLRTYLLLYGEWQQVSPLMLGIVGLKDIEAYLDIKHFKKLLNRKNSTIPCVKPLAWITYMPANKKLINTIERYVGIDLSILTNGNE